MFGVVVDNPTTLRRSRVASRWHRLCLDILDAGFRAKPKMPNRLPHLECLQKYPSKKKKPVQRMLNLPVRTARLRHDLADDALQYLNKYFEKCKYFQF
jgi:hypothetical protein